MLIIKKFDLIIFWLFLCGIFLFWVILIIYIEKLISFGLNVVVKLLLLDFMKISFILLWCFNNLFIVVKFIDVFLWIVVWGYLLVLILMIWFLGRIFEFINIFLFFFVYILFVIMLIFIFFERCFIIFLINCVLFVFIGLLILILIGFVIIIIFYDMKILILMFLCVIWFSFKLGVVMLKFVFFNLKICFFVFFI